MAQADTPDVLVIGAGIVGLCAALALAKRDPARRIAVIDKEPDVAAHGSGRNSGVLHAGFYYGADSLKARFCIEGNRRWQAWCDARGLPIRKCGKLVVARTEAEHAGLDELLRRAAANGVELQDVTEAEARELEPRVRTAGRALFAPSTASVDPAAVTRSVADACRDAGVDLRLGVAYTGRDGADVRTSTGTISPGFVLNAAGLYADVVARDFGFGEHVRILPFKGLYLVGSHAAGELQRHIYPVPDLHMPFLGVHFTVTVDGHVKIGPTALPALWRENYGGLAGFSAAELADVLVREGVMLATDRTFGRLAWQELGKAFRTRLVRLAEGMLDGVDPAHYRTWGRPGIRAQLLDTRTRKLVMDFAVEGDDRSLHVLNAVSPAFTCALPFADHLVALMDAA